MQRPATDDEESVKVATASSDWLVSDQEEELIRLLVADSDHTVEHWIADRGSEREREREFPLIL